MSDLRTQLERAGRMAPPLELEAFEGLRAHRDRKARRGRVATELSYKKLGLKPSTGNQPKLF